MIRYELDGTATLVASEGATSPHVRAGERREGYPSAGPTATVSRTGQAARVDDYRDIPGGEPYLREGPRSAVATPIHVNGRRMFPPCRGLATPSIRQKRTSVSSVSMRTAQIA
jgi:hypothetical protein